MELQSGEPQIIFRNLYQILLRSPNQEEHDKREGHMGDMRGAYRVLVWKHEGKWPLEIPTQRLKNNMKTYLIVK